ncbi:hypothetical protein HPP92_004421 [Vanilla planifolia]|uniref:Uncharacterized protein n=1 Tax=Vanilla planifolia TaxID=51239 RepID=A0A835RXC7_VANPL|nr:hypothetical protein HPP92_004421 [Vanilla planifolia]
MQDLPTTNQPDFAHGKGSQRIRRKDNDEKNRVTKMKLWRAESHKLHEKQGIGFHVAGRRSLQGILLIRALGCTSVRRSGERLKVKRIVRDLAQLLDSYDFYVSEDNAEAIADSNCPTLSERIIKYQVYGIKKLLWSLLVPPSNLLLESLDLAYCKKDFLEKIF